MARQDDQTTPLYIGCITRAAGRPALLFSTGLLVQDDRDPARAGWYAFAHPNLLFTHITEDQYDAFIAAESSPALIDQVYRMVVRRYVTDVHQALQGHPVVPAANQTYLALIDIDDVEDGRSGAFYTLHGRLLLANDPHLPAAWHQAQAMQALGPLDAQGRPTRPAQHATAPGITRFI